MIYLNLLIGFLKVGLFSFGGGYGAVPLIKDVVMHYKWMNEEQLANVIAISESSPGPIMVNLATYVGSTKGGILGGLIATLAVVTPAFFIILIVMFLLKKLWITHIRRLSSGDLSHVLLELYLLHQLA